MREALEPSYLDWNLGPTLTNGGYVGSWFSRLYNRDDNSAFLLGLLLDKIR